MTDSLRPTNDDLIERLEEIGDPETRPFAYNETMWKAVRRTVTEAASAVKAADTLVQTLRELCVLADDARAAGEDGTLINPEDISEICDHYDEQRKGTA